jgi:hypothetical protein
MAPVLPSENQIKTFESSLRKLFLSVIKSPLNYLIMTSGPIVSELQGVASPDFMSLTSAVELNKKELRPGVLQTDEKLPTGPWGSAPTIPSAPWGSVSPNAKSSASFWAQKSPAVNAIADTSASYTSPVVKPNSFADIMSEELAVQLSKEEELKVKDEVKDVVLPKSLPVAEDEDLLTAIKLSQEESARTGKN